MKRILVFAMVIVLLTGFSGLIPSAIGNTVNVNAASPQNYTVLVGAENSSRGVDVEGFFPAVLHVHSGDTVTWKRNTNEIHTVTFLASGQSLPDLLINGLVVNPLAAAVTPASGSTFNGNEYVNSGIFGPDPGMQSSYALTFTDLGTYTYYCIVHGMMMSGTIVVDPSTVRDPSPAQVSLSAKNVIAKQLAQGYGLFSAAVRSEKPPVTNPDGTRTYFVKMGFMSGNIDLMDFFPSRLVVKPGDTVVWELSDMNNAPHTVTFLNGNPEPPLIVFNGTDLMINPLVAAPQNAGQPLTRNGVYNSGLLVPGVPGLDTYSLKIGNVQGNFSFLCQLHDASGMVGSLFVASQVDH